MANTANSFFNTAEEALAFKAMHQHFGLVPERIEGRGKWALVFPLKAHVTVIPHTRNETTSTSAH